METKIEIETPLGIIPISPRQKKFKPQILEMEYEARRARLKQELVSSISFEAEVVDVEGVGIDVLRLIFEIEPGYEKCVITRVLPSQSVDWF